MHLILFDKDMSIKWYFVLHSTVKIINLTLVNKQELKIKQYETK